MICNNCGCSIDVPAHFCPKCGADLAGGVRRRPDLKRGLSSRQDVLAKLRRLKRTFACQERNYFIAAAALARLEAAGEKRRNLLPAGIALVWTVVFFWAAYTSAGTVGMAGALSLGAVALAPAIVLCCMTADRAAKARRDRQTVRDCCRSIASHYHRVENNPLAFEYCNPPTLDALSEIVRLDRADTLEEAVWTLEHEQAQLKELGIKEKKFDEVESARHVADLAARLEPRKGDRPVAALRF